MRRLTLQRLAESPDGTLGRILELGLCTLEEEAADPLGHPRVPAGSYTCERDYYHRGDYETFEIKDVEGRSRILFHIGNTEEDTAGCVLVGLEHGVLAVRDEETKVHRTKTAVLRSTEGFRRFMRALDGEDSFRLAIYDPNAPIPEPVVQMIDSGIADGGDAVRTGLFD